MGLLLNVPVLNPTPNLSQNRWEEVEKYPFQISANWLEIIENVSGAHLRTSTGCGVMLQTIYMFRQNPQLNERRSSTVCEVAEWPDHHCGDDLVCFDSQTERHAKSMEIAQEEVLTCLGVHLHDRFFRIQQKLKVEDKSWQLLYAIGMDGLRRHLEASFDNNILLTLQVFCHVGRMFATETIPCHQKYPHNM